MADRAKVLRGRRAECDVLRGLVEAVRAGQSRALVVRGEPGVGKTALLEYLAARAPGCQVARAAGVESEKELAFAGLHQLCAPMLDRLGRLPGPRGGALRTAFGMSAGPAPEWFLVGLAVLGLLSEVAVERPLVCLVDDQQCLDRASAQVLAFVARRLRAEPVALVFAAPVPGGDLAGLPELVVEGLREEDARALLGSALAGPLDERVRDQFIAEARGNPLALLELPRGLGPAQLAGGFGLPTVLALPGRIEDNFRRPVEALPGQARRLLLLAAAEPTGDAALLWRAAERLGIGADAAGPAADAGLAEFGARVLFRHHLVRSAAYRLASARERQHVHWALAEATDPAVDPDRRAWHQAQAAPGPGPDEDVAAALERSAGRAQARGGLAAAAAFWERATMLTPDPARRAGRALAAAQARREAGAPDAALGFLTAPGAGSPDPLRAAQAEHLRGQIAFDQQRGTAAPLLLDAARLLGPLNPGLARQAHLEALMAAMWAGHLGRPGGVREAAEAALAAPPAPDPPRAGDVLLDALALRYTRGYAAAVPALTRALELLLALHSTPGEARRWLWLVGTRSTVGFSAVELWDFESWHALAAGQAKAARDTGAFVHLQCALNVLARVHLLASELAAAAELLDEDQLIADATGNPPVAIATMMLAACRGQEAEATALIKGSVEAATARGLGRLADFADYASAVLYNGLGRHDAARDAAGRAFAHDQLGYGPFIVPELAEAASRTGDMALVQAALAWLSERTRATPTQWALGILARVRALLSQGQDAEHLYRESIDRLGRTRVGTELARAHLLYGEWLRRENRRVDAREQLRTACQMLDAMGASGFAERARRELQTTGQTVRKPALRRAGAAGHTLTTQEAQVARLACQGLSNMQISTRLFISPHTVRYHLRKVFTKLGISSRGQLHRVLPGDPGTIWSR